jgi:hypothetical protein
LHLQDLGGVAVRFKARVLKTVATSSGRAISVNRAAWPEPAARLPSLPHVAVVFTTNGTAVPPLVRFAQKPIDEPVWPGPTAPFHSSGLTVTAPLAPLNVPL